MSDKELTDEEIGRISQSVQHLEEQALEPDTLIEAMDTIDQMSKVLVHISEKHMREFILELFAGDRSKRNAHRYFSVVGGPRTRAIMDMDNGTEVPIPPLIGSPVPTTGQQPLDEIIKTFDRKSKQDTVFGSRWLDKQVPSLYQGDIPDEFIHEWLVVFEALGLVTAGDKPMTGEVGGGEVSFDDDPDEGFF